MQRRAAGRPLRAVQPSKASLSSWHLGFQQLKTRAQYSGLKAFES